ncbi:MAG: DUF1580 domain-containing protein [Planctomycetes bacterium]|nr:DUF1580 domain-containing protein [Planctomycetota bacterium]
MTPLDPADFKTLRPLRSYAQRLPSCREGRSLSRTTLERYAKRGDEEGVRLKTYLIGTGRFTTDGDVWAFLNRRNTSA